MKKRLIIVAVVLLAGYWGFMQLKAWQKTVRTTPDDAPPTTAVVGYTNVQFSLNGAGDIGPADQVSVRPEINGIIETLPVDIGDQVKKDSILFTLDDTDLQTQKASQLTEIESAKLQLEKGKRNFERSQQLFDDKLISLEVYQDTKTDFEMAKNAMNKAQRALDLINYQLTKTKILAPFDCTILTRPVSVGQAVSGSGGYNSGTEVLTIANLNNMIINAHINQADVTRLTQGQEVDVEVEAVPGLKLKGIIERIAPQAIVKNGIKGFPTRIQLKTLDARVRPGMTANLTIPVQSANNVLAVPLAAVFTDQNDRYVLIKKADSYERRPVEIGVADFFNVEVENGVKAGEVVALEQPKDSDLKVAGDPHVGFGAKPALTGGATNRLQATMFALPGGNSKTTTATNRPATSGKAR